MMAPFSQSHAPSVAVVAVVIVVGNLQLLNHRSTNPKKRKGKERRLLRLCVWVSR